MLQKPVIDPFRSSSSKTMLPFDITLQLIQRRQRTQHEIKDRRIAFYPVTPHLKLNFLQHLRETFW
jgi:hypothetical protein